MRECLWLVKCGIPFDVAFSLSPKKRAAFSIIMSELEGGKFNWETLSYEDPNKK